MFARFRYIDLKAAARGCGGRGPLWEWNGVEGCCEGTPGLCGRARQTAVTERNRTPCSSERQRTTWLYPS